MQRLVKLKYLGDKLETFVSIQGKNVNITVDKDIILEVNTKIARLLMSTGKFCLLKKKSEVKNDDPARV